MIAALELALTDAQIDDARASFEAWAEDADDCGDPDQWAALCEAAYARILRRLVSS